MQSAFFMAGIALGWNWRFKRPIRIGDTLQVKFRIDDMRIPMIGPGYIGSAHARSVAAPAPAELVVVYGRSEEKCAAVAGEWGARPEKSASTLIAASDIERSSQHSKHSSR